MSVNNDRWGGPSWAFQDKADAVHDLLDGQALVGSGGLEIEISDAGTNTVVDAAVVSHVTSGTATTGLGVGLAFDVENAGGTQHEAARIEALWTTATADSEDSDLVFSVYDGGSLAEVLRIQGANKVLAVADPGTGSTKDPTTATEDDWLQIKVGSTDYYIPLYAAS